MERAIHCRFSEAPLPARLAVVIVGGTEAQRARHQLHCATASGLSLSRWVFPG